MFTGFALIVELWLAAGLVATLMMAADIRWNIDADDRRGFTWGDLIQFGLLSVFLGPITLFIAIFLTIFNLRYWVSWAEKRGSEK